MASLVEIIEKKAKNDPLSQQDIEVFVKAVAQKTIEEAQIGAFLMAVRLNDMNEDECAALTSNMSKYGDVLSWQQETWSKRVVDKHSTGGVGDKISLILAPAVAVFGAKVPMISGRGLGFTGGTLDKLESIPGYRVDMTVPMMKRSIENVGLFIGGQTESIAPVDKKLYSVRDISGTVYSDPLIVSSIMSKKLIEGLHVLLLDVKVGKAAIMKEAKEAHSLAKKMIQVGHKCGIEMVAFLTRMDHPIGHAIGNALEVADSLRGLNNLMADDQRELVVKEGGILLYLSGLATSFDDGQHKIEDALKDGRALNKFKELIMNQGVSAEMAEKLCEQGDFPVSHYMEIMNCNDATVTTIKSEEKGVVTSINALELALFSRDLGAGRTKASDELDYSVGFYQLKKVGDKIEKDEEWLEVYHRNPLTEAEIEKLQACLTVEEGPFTKPSMILRIVAKH